MSAPPHTAHPAEPGAGATSKPQPELEWPQVSLQGPHWPYHSPKPAQSLRVRALLPVQPPPDSHLSLYCSAHGHLLPGPHRWMELGLPAFPWPPFASQPLPSPSQLLVATQTPWEYLTRLL